MSSGSPELNNCNGLLIVLLTLLLREGISSAEKQSYQQDGFGGVHAWTIVPNS